MQLGPMVSQVMPIMEVSPVYSMARNASGIGFFLYCPFLCSKFVSRCHYCNVAFMRNGVPMLVMYKYTSTLNV